MSRPVAARDCPVSRVRVLSIEKVAPRITRMIVGGPGISRFRHNHFTDAYARILFPVPGITYPTDFDMRVICAQLPRNWWPKTRTYTVRRVGGAARELAIDFLSHGRGGLTGAWLAGVRPGDEALLQGAGGGYRPDPAAGSHLLAGDEVALPAIAEALAALPAGAPAQVVIETESPADELPLPTSADAEVRWLHRGCSPRLLQAVRALPPGPGPVHAFVHGEGGAMRELRRHLLQERGLEPRSLSISGYWRCGKTDEGWRAEKAAERAVAAMSAGYGVPVSPHTGDVTTASSRSRS